MSPPPRQFVQGYFWKRSGNDGRRCEVRMFRMHFRRERLCGNEVEAWSWHRKGLIGVQSGPWEGPCGVQNGVGKAVSSFLVNGVVFWTSSAPTKVSPERPWRLRENSHERYHMVFAYDSRVFGKRVVATLLAPTLQTCKKQSKTHLWKYMKFVLSPRREHEFR